MEQQNQQQSESTQNQQPSTEPNSQIDQTIKNDLFAAFKDMVFRMNGCRRGKKRKFRSW